jgi:hypothetical protein
LGAVPHVVRIRVCAPYELRVKRMMDRIGTADQAFVEKEIRMSEEAHGAITRRHFDVNWKDTEHYDLVLNTERLSIEECADEVLNLLKTPRFSETDQSLQKLRDMGITAHVRAALRHDTRTAKLDITIEVNNGCATLSGIVNSDEESTVISELTASVSGVGSVVNNLKTTARAHRRFDS